MLHSKNLARLSFLPVCRSVFSLLLVGLFPMTAFAALTASVSATPDATPFLPGQVRTIRIQLANNDQNFAVNNLTLNSVLPGTSLNGLKIASSPSATTNCGAPGTFTLVANPGDQSFQLTGGTVPAADTNGDGTCFVDIPFTANTSSGAAANYQYTLLANAVTGQQNGTPVANGQDVGQGFNTLVIAKPLVSKSFANGTLVLGGAATTLTVKVANPNAVAIDNFTIADAFPQVGGSAIIKVAANPPPTATCSDGSTTGFAPSAGDTSIMGTGAALPANGSCTFTVGVEANQTNNNYSFTQDNVIPATGLTTGLGLEANGEARATITVNSPLRVSKSFGTTGTLSNGEDGTLTITFTNDGSSPLPITSFSDSPIDGLGGASVFKGLFVTGASSNCGTTSTTSHTDVGVTLTGGSIPQKVGNTAGSCTITVNFTGRVQANREPISYNNTIPEGAVVTSPGIRSHDASASILVADDLRVLKTATPVAVAPGNPIRYAITVQNFSASVISNVSVKDTLINGQTYLNGPGFAPQLSAGCGTLTDLSVPNSHLASFVIQTLPGRTTVNAPGACTITMWAMTDKDGTGTAGNTIDAGDVCYNSGAICNTGGTSVNPLVNNVAVLAATKAFANYAPGETSFNEGTVVRMTVRLTNRSANQLTNVTISDPFSANGDNNKLLIATPSNAASTCGTPTITAVAGSNSIVMNGATVPARGANGTGADGTCFLQVDVTGAAGTYSNVANISGTETLANGQTRTVTPLDTAPVQVAFRSALSANKSFNPASVTSGGKSTVTVQLLNGSALPLTHVAFTDTFPTGMVLATPPNAYSTCAGSPVVTATAGSGSISLAGATINSNGNCSVLFDVIASGNANWVNVIPAKGVTADGGVSNVVAASATLLHAASTDLIIQKHTNPSTLTFPGQVSRLTIDIQSGTQGVTNMGVTDHFTTDGFALNPANAYNGWLITENPSASTTCAGGLVVAEPGSRSVSLSIAALPANTACAITVNVTSSVSGGVNNIIPPGALHTDQGLTNSGPGLTSLATSSNIGVVKKFTPNVVKPGERSRLSVTIYNPGAQAATNVSVTDPLPANVTIPANPNPTTTCGGTVASSIVGGVHQVALTGGSMPAAAGTVPASCEIGIDVFVASAGDYVNTIPAGNLSATIGGSTVNNTAPTTDTLRAKAPLTVHKAFSDLTLDTSSPFTTGSDSKAPGTPAKLTIRLSNPNSPALTGATWTDNLPANLVVANTPAATTTCAGGQVVAGPSGTSIRLTGATIPAAGSCDVTVDVLSNISGTYTNTINAGSVTTNEGVTNEAPTRAALIVSTPPTVSKQFAPAVIPSNGISRLSIVIGNENDSAMTLTANFDDVLPTAPGQIRVAATPNMQTTCGGTVQAAAGATTIRLLNGGTIPAGGCTIDVDVTGATTGVHTNNIPAGALQTSLGSNQQPANSPLTISTQGYISGKVFKDNNITPNGTFDTGTDAPIIGAPIELHSGPSCTGPLLATTTTDTLGNYIFTPLVVGAYSVCQRTPPPGTTNGQTTAGVITGINGSTGAMGAASNPTATTSQIVNIVLNSNGASGEISGSSNNNFAEVASSSISGQVFKDNNSVPNGVFDGGSDDPLANVTIQLLNAANVVIATTKTDANGNYSFDGLQPGTYSVLQPTQPSGTSNGITTAGAVGNGGTQGIATTPAVSPSRISTIVLPPNTSSAGNNFAEEPRGGAGGVVYDAVTRQPVAGAVVTIKGPAGFNETHVVGGSLSSTTGPDGLYQFLLDPLAPAGTYTLVVTTYPAAYLQSPSAMIPACNATLLVASTPELAEIQNGTGAPSSAIPLQTPTACPQTSGAISASNRATSQYYFSFNLSNSGPTRSGNVINNHIPLDPLLGGAILVTKSTPMVNVVRSDLVPYTVTATNTLSSTLSGIELVDNIPAGFRYRTGSATLDGVRVEPKVEGRKLTWLNQTFGPASPANRKTIRLLLVVGTGVSEGEYVNQALARNTVAGAQVSNLATATVRVVPDPTFDCSDIIGKVFDDKDANGYQDQGEPGIPNVRVATARGLLVTTDHEGRFHVACADIPNADRGANFVMKLDERTLPSGYRITTENPRDVRVTRGKMTKLNFGATVHRVVRVEFSAAAFDGNGTQLQAAYAAELEKLPAQLQERPSVLRIAYRRGAEPTDLAKKRIDVVSDRIRELWKEKQRREEEDDKPLVPLMIETEMEAAR